MRNTLFSSLLAAFLATVSVSATAAPATSTVATPPAVAATMADLSPVAGKVNINTADALLLQTSLSGIGLNKANAIVAYRETNGNFTSVDELIEVKGIGKTLLDKNRDKISLE